MKRKPSFSCMKKFGLTATSSGRQHGAEYQSLSPRIFFFSRQNGILSFFFGPVFFPFFFTQGISYPLEVSTSKDFSKGTKPRRENFSNARCKQNMRITWETSSTMSCFRENSTKGLGHLRHYKNFPNFLIFNWNHVNLNNEDAFEGFNFLEMLGKMSDFNFCQIKDFFRPLKVGINLKEHSAVAWYCVPLFRNTSIILVNCRKIQKLVLIRKERKILNLFTFFVKSARLFLSSLSAKPLKCFPNR